MPREELTMANLTREEFASAVSTSVSSVLHVYRETLRMISGLRQELLEHEEPLAVMRATWHKGARDSTGLLLRYEYGLLFETTDEIEDDDDLELDEAEGEEAEAEADEEPVGKKKKLPVELDPLRPLLCVRVVLYDARKSEGFEPCVQFAALGEWSTAAGVPAAGQPLLLARYMLKRIPATLAARPQPVAGQRIATRAKVRTGKKGPKGSNQLSCKLLTGIRSKPLFELDSPDAIPALAREMRELWESLPVKG
jgi:hypothetical protein